MGTTADKLQNIIDSKAAISAAIETKGGTTPTALSGYAQAILDIPSGDSSSWLLDPENTYVKNTDGNITYLHLTGTLQKNAVDAQALSATNVQLGTDLTAVVGSKNVFNWDTTQPRVLSVDFPSSIKSIGSQACWGNWEMHPIFHEGLETIGYRAFADTHGGVDDLCATKIIEDGIDINELGTTIPSTVKSIGNSAFENMIIKQPLVIPSTLTSIGSIAFKNTARTAPGGNYRTSLSNVICEGRTIAEVKAMSNYPWGITTGQGYIHCTDGDI